MSVTTLFGVKGGSGTSVVAAAVAVLAARSEGTALLVDRDGDQPALLGLPEPEGPGVHDWLASGRDPSVLSRLEVCAGNGLALLPRGAESSWPEDRDEELAAVLVAEDRPVIVDAGTVDAIAAGRLAGRRVLVVRPCYLALRRASTLTPPPDEVVLVRDVGRALSRRDVEDILGAPVRAVTDVDPAVARAVDAGIFTARLPATLGRTLRRLL